MTLRQNNNQEDDLLSSKKMKEMLDTVDKVRATLGGLKNSNSTDFYEELLSSLPQFVACGPQSAGKSSVIRRVSGVSLPEASTLCTRIATIIQIRRSSSSSSDDKSTVVTLTGPDGKTILNDRVDTDDDGSKSVLELVEKAQAEALRISPSKQFIEDHSIHVHVTGPALPNVTLVDLPGFHTADDADTKTVNDMVKRYIDMPGTLVLHVVKGDQDYASMLGNDFMRQDSKHDAGRVTVLTHCDKLDAKSAGDITRLQTTLDTTADNSTLTVALLGCTEDDEEEQYQLKHLRGMDDRLEVGVKDLSIHLEDRMREHLYTQFPRAVTKLETSLIDINKNLEEIREKSPIEILYEMSQTIRENFRNKKSGFMNDLRLVLEEMTTAIKNYVLDPVKSPVFINIRDQFDEVLEPGQMVYTSIEDENLARYVVKQNGDKVTLMNKTGSEIITKKISDLWSSEVAHIDCMVVDIGKHALDRGMRNLVHADRQPIIAVYANEFAKYYTDILRKTLEKINKKLDTLYNHVFSINIHYLAKPVAELLRNQMENERNEALKITEMAIDAMSAHNTDPDLIFSPNEHYLNSLVQKMVEADECMASDSGGARHIFHNIRAYIKVQRKYISELASKELIRTTIIETGSRFEKLLSSNIGKPDLIALIKEPSTVTRKRQTLLKRKKVLKEALGVLKKSGHHFLP
jgi:GTP-binding protein EngB required for normal cell division